MSGRHLFLALELWAGTPHSSGETPQRDSAPSSHQHTVCKGPASACSREASPGCVSPASPCGSFPAEAAPSWALTSVRRLEGLCANLYSPLGSSPIWYFVLANPPAPGCKGCFRGTARGRAQGRLSPVDISLPAFLTHQQAGLLCSSA